MWQKVEIISLSCMVVSSVVLLVASYALLFCFKYAVYITCIKRPHYSLEDSMFRFWSGVSPP